MRERPHYSRLLASELSGNIIPPDEADLLIHRFVTERIRVASWFVSADGSVNAKLTGFVGYSTRSDGLNVVSELTPIGGLPIPCWMTFKGVTGSVCRYWDETEVPPDCEYGSGLRLNMPNGDALVILEIREKKL